MGKERGKLVPATGTGTLATMRGTMGLGGRMTGAWPRCSKGRIPDSVGTHFSRQKCASWLVWITSYFGSHERSRSDLSLAQPARTSHNIAVQQCVALVCCTCWSSTCTLYSSIYTTSFCDVYPSKGRCAQSNCCCCEVSTLFTKRIKSRCWNTFESSYRNVVSTSSGNAALVAISWHCCASSTRRQSWEYLQVTFSRHREGIRDTLKGVVFLPVKTWTSHIVTVCRLLLLPSANSCTSCPVVFSSSSALC